MEDGDYKEKEHRHSWGEIMRRRRGRTEGVEKSMLCRGTTCPNGKGPVCPEVVYDRSLEWWDGRQTVTERSFLEEEAWGPSLSPYHVKNPPLEPLPRHTHISE